MSPGLLGHRHIISLATRGHGRYSHDGFQFKIDVLNPPTSKTMRLIFIDIETTGFDPSPEGRIVEIACIEMLDGTHLPVQQKDKNSLLAQFTQYQFRGMQREF